MRSDLRDYVRSLGNNPSDLEVENVAARRDELQRNITLFHGQMTSHLPGEEWEEVMVGQAGTDDDFLESDDEEQEGEDKWPGTEAEEPCPELVKLALPSSFSPAMASRPEFSVIVGQEKELRIAQANESLERLRLSLGLKLALFRKVVRTSKSQKTKTKAWRSVHRVEGTVRTHARNYGRMRRALISLGVDKKTLERFQAITEQDLKMNGDIVEENRFGQKSDMVSWLWRMDGRRNETEWMEESKCLFTLLIDNDV